MNPEPEKKIRWADIEDEPEPEPPKSVIDKNGIKVPYVPPHLRKDSRTIKTRNLK
jgi:hypothetical protein